MEIVEWANLVPLQLITWLEYIVVGGLALAAVYALWLNWKHRGSNDGMDWLDTETYEERRQREAAAKAAAPQETAAAESETAADEPASADTEPEPAAAEPVGTTAATEPAAAEAASTDTEPEPAAAEPGGDGR